MNRPPRDERGFSLVEVLVVAFILSVGLAAVAIGLQHATSGIETGKSETTAAFLAPTPRPTGA